MNRPSSMLVRETKATLSLGRSSEYGARLFYRNRPLPNSASQPASRPPEFLLTGPTRKLPSACIYLALKFISPSSTGTPEASLQKVQVMVKLLVPFDLHLIIAITAFIVDAYPVAACTIVISVGYIRSQSDSADGRAPYAVPFLILANSQGPRSGLQ